MKLRLLFIVMWFYFLGLVQAQEVSPMADDSLKSNPAVADSLAMTDSLTLADDSLDNLEIIIPEEELLEAGSLADSTAVAKEEPVILPDNPALRAAWRRLCPFVEPSAEALRVARADSLHPSAIRLRVDSLPFDGSLSYAQADLRMPLVLDAQVPQCRRPSLTQLAQQEADRQSLWAGSWVESPYGKQLDYGAERKVALFRYAMQNLDRVARMRPEFSDLPTERRRIERQELSGEEQIDTSLGLELETASLNMEQVTFHADKWHRKGTTDLQISQTALSDNWYKGGDNNMTISNYDKLVFSRYDESMKTTLDITLELRLSGYYTKADTIHPMRVNDNQFRIDVSYGYKAWKNWYYSSSAYIKTPVFEYYAANSKTVKNTFLAPMELNVAVGMDLKLTKNKNRTYSLMLAPLSYNLKYVGDDRVSETAYGIKAGHRSLNQVGASVTSKLEWKINEAVSWSSRAYFFTSYHNVLLEYENTFNVTLGRYSTAKVYLYPRFDDSVDKKLQMKEILTFGMAFVW